jgi:hypothetical protein
LSRNVVIPEVNGFGFLLKVCYLFFLVIDVKENLEERRAAPSDVPPFPCDLRT